MIPNEPLTNDRLRELIDEFEMMGELWKAYDECDHELDKKTCFEVADLLQELYDLRHEKALLVENSERLAKAAYHNEKCSVVYGSFTSMGKCTCGLDDAIREHYALMKQVKGE